MIYFKILLYKIYQNVYTRILTKNINLSKTKANMILFMAPDYGNIGDLAIEYAQKKFMNDQFKNHNIISLDLKDTYKYLKSIRRQLSDQDMLFLIGGGNFGGLYPSADMARIFILNYFNTANIISMPQSYTSSNNYYSNYVLKKYKIIASINKKTLYFARDKDSYKRMKSIFNHHTRISPDIVLYLISYFKKLPNVPRNGITLTLRNDNEKSISEIDTAKLTNIIKKTSQKIRYCDTSIDQKNYVNNNKKIYINNIFKIYRSSSLVITDRLHGMIFAFVTGTPCIILDNKNHKIKAAYSDWLSQSNYLHFAKKIDETTINRYILKFLDRNFKPNFRTLSIDFSELAQNIKRLANNNNE